MDTQPGRRRHRIRTLAALGLFTLPLVGTALVLPTMASASDAEQEVTEQSILPVGDPQRAAFPVETPVQPEQPGAEQGAQVPPAQDPQQPAQPAGASEVADAGTADPALADAFYAAGYSYDDAVLLAQRWGVFDAFQAKVKAGAYLEQGIALADSPLADPSADDGLGEDALIDVFFTAGYTDDEVAVLAQEWGIGAREAKVKAGSALKTVGVLPFVDIVPLYGSPDGPVNVDAFFTAGYDYDDAVLLAESWGLGEPYEAKVKAGSLLIAGEPLPEVAGVGVG